MVCGWRARFFGKKTHMGDLVGKKAAASIIMADVETTYEKAKARGGKWFELAERMISGPLKLKEALATQLHEAETAVRPLRPKPGGRSLETRRLSPQDPVSACGNRVLCTRGPITPRWIRAPRSSPRDPAWGSRRPGSESPPSHCWNGHSRSRSDVPAMGSLPSG